MAVGRSGSSNPITSAPTTPVGRPGSSNPISSAPTTRVPMTPGLKRAEPVGRLISLDAYRGFVMLAMASVGFGFPAAYAALNEPGMMGQDVPQEIIHYLAHQFSHVDWLDCTFWDLIQPSFMFIVGVSLPFSVVRRRQLGQTEGVLWGHVVWRSLVLVALGVFLASNGKPRTEFVFTNVLAQIGLAYPVLFLLAGRPLWMLWGTFLAIVTGYWLWFAWHPLPPVDFDYTTVGMKPDWTPLAGFAAH
ncbi:MAG: heparan-alpha-glucosaminide N-acetyltransferase domain-containing protein, partial [Planctomycetia bacterium]